MSALGPQWLDPTYLLPALGPWVRIVLWALASFCLVGALAVALRRVALRT